LKITLKEGLDLVTTRKKHEKESGIITESSASNALRNDFTGGSFPQNDVLGLHSSGDELAGILKDNLINQDVIPEMLNEATALFIDEYEEEPDLL
jgi:hypothetical protein